MPAAIVLAGTVILVVLTSGIYPTYYAGLTARNSYTDRAIALPVWRNVWLLGLLTFILGMAVDGLVNAPGKAAKGRAATPRRRTR